MLRAVANIYSEGTWTPVLSDGTNNATSTVNTTGRYAKIGGVVNVWGRIQVSSLGAMAGSSRITGLPFLVTNIQSNYGGVTFGLAAGLNIVANQVPTGFFFPNATYIELRLWDAATGPTQLLVTELTAATDLYFFGSYQTPS